MGFEPTVRCRTLVFKTSAFDRSANSPIYGRSTRIRTLDLCIPNAAHYQTVLYSVIWHRVRDSNPLTLVLVLETSVPLQLYRPDLNFLFLHKKTPNIISARGLLNITFLQSRVKTYPSLTVSTNSVMTIVVLSLTR